MSQAFYTSSDNVEKRYHPEIEGLRTLGALMVAVCHIWLGRVSGGVDVFFVISGFLISRALIEAGIHKKIDFLRFWGRIIRRVAPVAYLVLVSISVFSILYFPQSGWSAVLSDAKFSFIHLENWKLVFDEYDYLARDTMTSPFMHFWALSVQMQFYALWPFVIAFLLLLSRWFRTTHMVLLLGFSTLFLVSFSYSLWLWSQNDSSAHFNTGARLWEFVLGGIIYLILPYWTRVVPHLLKCILGWVGLLGIITTGLIFAPGTLYPGYASLLPTLSTGMVMLACAAEGRVGVKRILWARLVEKSGRYAFAFYLWHWPVFVLALHIYPVEQVGLLYGALVIAVSALLSFLTVRCVEQPLRYKKQGVVTHWRQNYVLGVAAALPAATVLFLWNGTVNESRAFQRSLMIHSSQDSGYPGAMVPTVNISNQIFDLKPIVPGPMVIHESYAEIYNRPCHQSIQGMEAASCIYGENDSNALTVAMVGGSHVAHWFPAMRLIAERRKWRLIVMTKSGCILTNTHLPTLDASCAVWNKNVLTALKDLHVDAVFTTATRPPRDWVQAHLNKAEYIPPEHISQWKKLTAMGITVLALRDTPWMGREVVSCVERSVDRPEWCAISRDHVLGKRDAYEAMIRHIPKRVGIIDISDRFCDERLCFAVMGNVAIYRDGHHITVPYMKSLSTALENRILAHLSIKL